MQYWRRCRHIGKPLHHFYMPCHLDQALWGFPKNIRVDTIAYPRKARTCRRYSNYKDGRQHRPKCWFHKELVSGQSANVPYREQGPSEGHSNYYHYSPTNRQALLTPRKADTAHYPHNIAVKQFGVLLYPYVSWHHGLWLGRRSPKQPSPTPKAR